MLSEEEHKTRGDAFTNSLSNRQFDGVEPPLVALRNVRDRNGANRRNHNGDGRNNIVESGSYRP